MFYKKICEFIYSKYGLIGLKDFLIKSVIIRLNFYFKYFFNIFKSTYSHDIYDVNKTNKIFDYEKDEEVTKSNFNSKTFDNISILGTKISNFFHSEKHESWIENNINFSNRYYSLNIYKKFFKKLRIKSKFNFIKWNYDPKNNYYWSSKKNSFFMKIDFNKKKDVKYPWEISRLQHLTVFALKIRKFKNENKKKNFMILKKQVFDFIISNPPGYGINWVSAMEVAIRGANLSVISDILDVERNLKENEKKVILNSIQDHINFVKDNLEWSYLNTSNHYLANIVGLIVMSYYLPRSNLNKKILSFSCNQLINEIDKQFYSDGGSKEGSTAYHVFSNEIILIGLNFYLKLNKYEKNFDYNSLCSVVNKFSNIIKHSKKNEESFENEVLIKLQKINYFSSKCLRNNNTLLQIGDNDSGCFFPFNYLNFCDEKKHLHKNLIHKNKTTPFFYFMNKKTIKMKSNKINKRHFSKSNLCYFEKIYNKLPNLNKKKFFIKFKKKINLNDIDLDIFDKFGLYCFKSKEISLFIMCKKQTNFFNSGHNHDDNLGIDLVVNNETIITDPGSYCYTDNLKLRYLYRGLKAHFAPRSQKMLNQKITKKPFYFLESLSGKCEYINNRIFVGSIKTKNITIYRFLEIKDRGLLIKDFCKNDSLVDYPSLNQNLKISTSYGVLSNIKMINRNIIEY